MEDRERGDAYRQRHVVEQDVEARGALGQLFADEARHILTLGDELRGVELGDDALEHLVDDAGQNALIVVGAEGAVDLREGVDARPRQHTAGDVDHLQVLGARQGGDVAGLGPHVVHDGCFEPGESQMRAFGVDVWAYAADAGVFDCSATTVDCESNCQ